MSGAYVYPRGRTASALSFGAAVVVLAGACRSTALPAHEGHPEKSASAALGAPKDPSVRQSEPARDAALAIDDDLDAAARAILEATSSDAGALAYVDPMQLHRETTDELLSLFSVEQETNTARPDAFLRSMFKPTGPAYANQGNKAIARHTIGKEKCLEGLKDVVVQTPEQRGRCGAENMVPVWTKDQRASFCIDVFEFPNKACELPMVWTRPPLAKKVCELQGKRLCSDIEWNLACRGDPAGGPDRRYAYGDRLDLEICHTNLRHREPCVPQTAGTAWKTCTTDTEPSGAFPTCRSRFGVFDQHGNVAEVMTRRDGDRIVTQLKGSAWFYVELAKEPNEPVPATTTNKRGAYPDHCNFDPRWHVEPLERAMHVNYHLGFRCCKSIP